MATLLSKTKWHYTISPFPLLHDHIARHLMINCDWLVPRQHVPRFTQQSFQTFSFQQFHALWTLSSECFSSFPHGTCLLSVSCLYLALDGVSHPLWIAIPNNPTLESRATVHPCISLTFPPKDLTLLDRHQPFGITHGAQILVLRGYNPLWQMHSSNTCTMP